MRVAGAEERGRPERRLAWAEDLADRRREVEGRLAGAEVVAGEVAGADQMRRVGRGGR